MTTTIDTERIRNSTPFQTTRYYSQLKAQHSDGAITEQLLSAVERGSVSPSTFSPWLGLTKSPTIIREALQQNHSVLIRQFGIKYFRKRLNNSTWRDMWYGLGATSGILEIFADLSVKEIRMMCKAFGRCAKGKDIVEKRECVTELFKGLHPSMFRDTEHKTSDQRPLAAHYGLLLPACSQDLVEAALAEELKGAGKHVRERDLLENHPECLGQIQLTRLRDGKAKPANQEQMKVLTSRYRTTLPSSHGFSPSMNYALTCLRTLASLEKSTTEESFVVIIIIRPLLNRAVRKRIDWDKIQEIVDLSLKYFEKNPTAGRLLNTDTGDVIHLVACCWSRKPQLFGLQLRALLSDPGYGLKSQTDLTSWGSFLSGVLPARRYDLLQICIKASTGLDIGIEADLGNLKGGLSQNLLASLEPSQALDLFNRVRKVRGDYAFLEGSKQDSILHLGVAYHVMIRETPIWHFHLLKRNGDHGTARKLAEEYIEGRKRSAKTASQPEQRGHHARCAMYAAIASGSLGCYRNTLKWGDRFVNDTLVIREIYPAAFPSEAIRLLSGIPEPINSFATVSELHDSVEKANSILADMFDTACTAAMQPSFYQPAWNGVLFLFQRVVGERIKLTASLMKALTITNDELYDSLWKDTVKMLIAVEEKAHSEGCKKLGADSIHGIMGRQLWEDELEETKVGVTNPSAVRFLDQLAKAREELWCKLRGAAYPQLSEIPACLPRGLAVQHLISWWPLDVADLDSFAPYLASRVKKSLFPDPKLALQSVPTDKKSEDCIGSFVDSYKYALGLYIPASCSKDVRKERVQTAWDYAVTFLTHDRVKKVDVVRYWSDQASPRLREWPPQDALKATEWPVLPTANESGAPVSWNPFAIEGTDSSARRPEEPTYIDVSLAISLYNLSYRTIADTPSLKSLAYNPEILGLGRQWFGRENVNEAEVVLALLYLDAQLMERELLQSPYPSKADVRYPAISLSEDFLSNKSLSVHTAVQGIRNRLNDIPAELIHRLAQRALGALNAAESASRDKSVLHETVMQLIIRLGESDRPSLAIDLAIETIINRPKSSSWHRMLLKLSFLHRLSANDAAKCYAALTSRISQIVQDNATAKATNEANAIHSTDHPEKDDSEKPMRGPYVKVTTLKLLIQLITGTSIVNEQTALRTIGSLAPVATHIDVRLNIVTALLSMLNSYDQSHTDAVFTILDSIVSEAGNINKRNPITEQDWQKAEAALEPPNIQDIIREPLSTSSPMLNALLQHVHSEFMTPQALQAYLARTIFPIFAKQKQQTARWISIFLRKHGIDKAAEQDLKLPPVPWHTDVVLLRKLLSDSDKSKLRAFSASVFEAMITYAIYTIAPPPTLAALTKKLNDNAVLKVQPATQVYLKLYGRGLHNARNIVPGGGLFTLLDRFYALEKDSTAAFVDGGLTPGIIRTHVLRLFKSLVHNQPPSSTTVASLLDPVLQGKYLHWPWWPAHGAPILREMVDYVDGLRTPAWIADPNRRPTVLPDTFPWRLCLLDFPVPSTSDTPEKSEDKCLHFSSQLRDIIAEISTQPVYHAKLEQLTSYLALEPPSPPEQDTAQRTIRREILHLHRGLTATYIGNLAGEDLGNLESVLRVEVAGALLDGARVKEGSWIKGRMDRRIEGAAREMMGGWKGSCVEEVRRVGWEVEGGLWGVG